MKIKVWQAGVAGVAALVLAGCSGTQQPPAEGGAPAEPAAMGAMAGEAAADTEMAVEVGCAMCMYGMDGIETCVTAAKIDDQTYLVSGGGLDAHASGLCSTTKQATVTGHIAGGKLMATTITVQ